MALRLILRISIATVIVLVLGVFAVFGFTVVEPFYQSFGAPPSGLGWGNLGLHTVAFAAVGFIGLILVLVIWMVAAPIRADRRQQFRR